MNFMPIFPAEAIGASPASAIEAGPHATPRSGKSFADMLIEGVENANAKMAEADRLTQAFIVDDNIPVHQVTFALEQARLSLELMLQVRGRLVEGYQQLMNMQL